MTSSAPRKEPLTQASEEAKRLLKSLQTCGLTADEVGEYTEPCEDCLSSLVAYVGRVSGQALERAATEAENHFAGANIAAAIRRLKPEGR